MMCSKRSLRETEQISNKPLLYAVDTMLRSAPKRMSFAHTKQDFKLMVRI